MERAVEGGDDSGGSVKCLGKFGALYAGAEQGPGAYHGVNMTRVPDNLATICNPYTWYFFDYQGDLATNLKKLLQWFVKAGVPHTLLGHETTTEQAGALSKANMGAVLSIPIVSVTSQV